MRCRIPLAILVGALWALPLFADCNTAPTTTDDTVGTLDVRGVWIDPLANDSDSDGQVLALTLQAETCLGTVTTEDDLFLYQPLVGQAETCTITYKAGDGTATTNGSISLTVTVLTTEIFADSFESGNTTAWTATVQ